MVGHGLIQGFQDVEQAAHLVQSAVAFLLACFGQTDTHVAEVNNMAGMVAMDTNGLVEHGGMVKPMEVLGVQMFAVW